MFTAMYKVVTNENLLYSSGNSTQHSVVTYMRRESEKEGIYVYVWLIHFAVQWKLTEYCEAVGTMLQ